MRSKSFAAAAVFVIAAAGAAHAQTPAAPDCSSLAGLRIPASAIVLPTTGAVVETATAAVKDGPGAAVAYCVVVGKISPIDPKAPDIRYQLNLPATWNGKAVQFGGGGYNGRIPSAIGYVSHGLRSGPTPLARGYMTLSDDSGHQAESANDGLFAQNDEALANFGNMHIRKTHDVAVEVAKRLYGKAPARFYFAGGSTGGREGLTAALRWPEAYDGVISNYPTANFLGLRLQNAAISRQIYKDGSAGWIPPQLIDKMAAEALAECDALDGVADGVVSNMPACRAGSEARLAKYKCPTAAPPCLDPNQVATVRLYHEGFSDTWQPADSSNGFKGYNILEGVEMNAGDQPDFKYPLKEGVNAHAALRADEFLKYFVARDANFDLRGFDVQAPGPLTAQLMRISQVIGATSPDLSAFERKGGKLLLMQGADDALVSPYENIRRYQAIADKAGPAAARRFIRFYLVPGQGHGGGTFQVGWDNLDILDAWVDRGSPPPAVPVATDTNTKTAGRTRPLCEYPTWPRYKGAGDPNLAENFSCVR